MIENFPQLISDIKPQTQETQKTPDRIHTIKQNKTKHNPKTAPRHIIFKLQKINDKEKILKEARGKNTPYL